MVLKSIALVILSFLLVVSLSVSIIGLNASQLIYPDVYEDSFQKNGVYYLLSQKLPNNSAVTQVFFQGQIKANVNRLIEGSLAYVRSETDDIVFSLQIDEFNIRAYLEGVYPYLPVCTPGQYPLKDGEECRPQNMTSPGFVDYVLREKNITGSSVPINVPGIKEQLSRVRDIVRIFMAIVWTFTILSILFATGILLIKRTAGVKIIGICCIISGAISAIAGLFLSSVIGNFITQIKPELLADIFGDIIRSVFSGLVIVGIGAIIVGAVLIFIYKSMQAPKRHIEKHKKAKKRNS
jgi:hypothetical protein